MISHNNLDMALVVISWIVTVSFAMIARYCTRHGRRDSSLFLAFLAVLIAGGFTFVFVTHMPFWQLPALLFRRFFDGTYFRLCLLLFWSLCSLASLLFICIIVHNRRSHVSTTKRAGTVHRKFFHLTASLVTASGLFYDPPLLSLCVHLILQIFIIIEVLRSQRVKPFCDLDYCLCVFIDNRQESLEQITTPILLLIGLNLPILLDFRILTGQAATTLQQWHFSGLISVGVGDSAAALIGSKFGRFQWPSLVKDCVSKSASPATTTEENASLIKSAGAVIVSSTQLRRTNAKTVEGSFAMFVAQIVTAEWLMVFYPGRYSTHAWQSGGVCCSVSDIVPSMVAALIATLVEAHLYRLDNILVPLCSMLTLWIFG